MVTKGQSVILVSLVRSHHGSHHRTLRRKKMEEKVRETAPRRNIGATISSTGSAVKDGFVSTVKGINEIESQIVGLVKNTVSDTLHAAGSMAGDAVDVTRGYFRARSKPPKKLGPDCC